jgi:hypothetical protein
MLTHHRFHDLLAVAALTAIAAAPAVTRAGELLGSDVWPHRLIEIDRDDASVTEIGVHGVCTMSGLAYDSNNDVLYGIAPCTDNVYRVDRVTAEATMIGAPGALGYGNPNGLAYDPVSDVLYGTDNNTNALFTVDTQTGAAHEIAIMHGGFTEIEGLGFDAAAGILYGITQLQRRIVTIDTGDGRVAETSGELPDLIWRGLDYDSERRLLYASAVDIWGDSKLYSFDPESAQLAFVGETVGASSVQGLGFVPEPSSAVLWILAGTTLGARRRR